MYSNAFVLSNAVMCSNVLLFQLKPLLPGYLPVTATATATAAERPLPAHTRPPARASHCATAQHRGRKGHNGHRAQSVEIPFSTADGR